MTGKGSGSGKYSYHKRISGARSVYVSHMPENEFRVRIAFMLNGETSLPIMVMSTTEAEMLWAALNSMAADLGWKDFE